MSKSNVINFDGKRNNKPKDKSDINQQAKEIFDRASMIDLGTIFLDLYMDEDGCGISMLPSYSLNSDMDDQLIDEVADMLKTNFSACIDELFKKFKETID